MPTVLLLGASSDMAVALAQKFARSGYDIQLAARNAGRLDPLRSDLTIRHGISASLYEFDAGNFAQHADFFAALDPKPISPSAYSATWEISRLPPRTGPNAKGSYR